MKTKITITNYKHEGKTRWMATICLESCLETSFNEPTLKKLMDRIRREI